MANINIITMTPQFDEPDSPCVVPLDYYWKFGEPPYRVEYELDRPDQDGVSGKIVQRIVEYEYETAVELWRYEFEETFTFRGVMVNGSIYVLEEEIIDAGCKEINADCVRNHQEEMEAAFEAEQESLRLAA